MYYTRVLHTVWLRICDNCAGRRGQMPVIHCPHPPGQLLTNFCEGGNFFFCGPNPRRSTNKAMKPLPNSNACQCIHMGWADHCNLVAWGALCCTHGRMPGRPWTAAKHGHLVSRVLTVATYDVRGSNFSKIWAHLTTSWQQPPQPPLLPPMTGRPLAREPSIQATSS